MRVAIVSTYPPRACGIGTFSRDLRDALLGIEAFPGVDAAPEGGCALAAVAALVRDGALGPADEVVVFNTGSGASYRAEGVDMPDGARAAAFAA